MATNQIDKMKQENLVPVSLDYIKDKFKLYYSEKDDCVLLELDTNLVIHSNTSLIASKGDTIVLSGTSGEGNIHLNPSKMPEKNLLK